MQIKINETGEIKTINVVAANDIDWTNDFVGNNDGFRAGQITWDAEQDVYTADQATFDWWTDAASTQQMLDDRITELKEVHDSDEIYSVLADVGCGDMIDDLRQSMQLLDEAFGAAQ